MSSMSVVKSPTSVGVVPTLRLVPLVLMRTWRRSGNAGVSSVRVQKLIWAPFCKVKGGVKSQLLMVSVAGPPSLLKLAAI